MARTDLPRIAILGAGPIGLEAALYACKLGYPVTVYERGRIAEQVQRWGHVKLFSPFGMNATSLGKAAIQADNPRHSWPDDAACTTGKEHYAAYLEPLAKSTAMKECLRLDYQVLHIGRRGLMKQEAVGDPVRGRQPFRLLLRESKARERVEEAEIVIDCTGTYGKHRWLGDGGIPAIGESAAEQHILYGVENVLGERKTAYAGKSVLVVGSGYSAATTVCDLATLAQQHPETWVVWLGRGPNMQPLRRIPADPLRERDRLAMRANALATRREGNVEFHHQTVIDAVEMLGTDKGFRVNTRCAGKPRAWDVDRLIGNVGYGPDTSLYRELQVHECYASLGPMALATGLAKHGGADCLAVPPQGAAALRNPEPNFYILGAKSFGRNSQFLLRTGFDQVRDVFTLITASAGLDLYKRPAK